MRLAAEKPFRLTLAGRPATKKNSGTIVRRGSASILLPSEAYRKYEQSCREGLSKLRMQGSIRHFDGPVWIVAHYYLRDHAHWPDLLGLEQATADIISDEYRTIARKRTLVQRWILSDDRIIKSWDGSKIAGVDKNCPRTELTIYKLPLDGETELDPKLRRLAATGTQATLFDDAGHRASSYNGEHYKDMTAAHALRSLTRKPRTAWIF